MSKIKVYEVEEKFLEKLQKNIKKCVLQEEGMQYPHKNVTVWNDLDIYDQIVEGYKIPEGYYVKSEDSNTPNPHGGFYKNRQLLKGQGTAPTGNLEARVKKLEDKVFGAKPEIEKHIEENVDVVDESDIPF